MPPAPSPAVAHHRAKVAAFSRDRAPDDPALLLARRDLAAANLDSYIRKVVDSAPPLSDEQRHHLAALLSPYAGGTS